MKKFSLMVILVTLAAGYPMLYGGGDYETFAPGPITNLQATHKAGDWDFFDNGPDVKATAQLILKESNTEVWVYLTLHETETQSDWTEFKGEWYVPLWTVPAGYTIVEICTDQSSYAAYTDSNFDWDYPTVQGGTLVSKFEILGDKLGSDDARMNVYLNQVTVKIGKK